MRKFKYEDGTDGIIYETLDELLMLSNIEVYKCDEFFYINVIEDAPYYNTIYKVDTKTKKASYYGDKIGFMLDIKDKATPVDPKTLRRAS